MEVYAKIVIKISPADCLQLRRKMLYRFIVDLAQKDQVFRASRPSLL